jgi:ornithine racemase
MGGRVLAVDLEAIESNARAIVDLCARHGLEVTGVTKGVGGHPEVARAMLRGGVTSIGESRLENLKRLREAGVETRMMLLRMPSITHAPQVVELADVSLNSELDVLAALSTAAERAGRHHEVVVMTDLGDLREGVWPDDVERFVDKAMGLPGIRITGLGANLTCFGGVLPTVENMSRLVELAARVEELLGRRLDLVSGGNSSALPLIAAGDMPARVDHVRIGEGILLGRETGARRPWPGTRQDAIVLHGEVVELKPKPSMPVGPRGQDALGRTPSFADLGLRDHALVNLGAIDAALESLTPLDPRLAVVGGTSDYLVLDATDAHGDLRVGDDVAFAVGYAALATASTSPYVEVRTHPGR